MPVVDVVLAVCGDRYSRVAMSAIRSLHYSVLQHDYDATVHIMHDNTTEAIELRQVWAGDVASCRVA